MCGYESEEEEMEISEAACGCSAVNGDLMEGGKGKRGWWMTSMGFPFNSLAFHQSNWFSYPEQFFNFFFFFSPRGVCSLWMAKMCEVPIAIYIP